MFMTWFLVHVDLNHSCSIQSTAHQHKNQGEDDPVAQQPAEPTQKIPISSRAEIEQELPTVVDKTLNNIVKDKIHAQPTSKHGHTMLVIARQLLLVNAIISSYLLNFCATLMVNAKTLDINELRKDADFIEGFLDIVLSNVNFELDIRCARMFVQRFLTSFVNCFCERQLELMNLVTKKACDEVTDNDKQVLYFMCGYILHAMKKRYMMMKSKTTGAKFCVILNMLATDKMTSNQCQSSKWTDSIDRGGLKRPTEKFFLLILQIERWTRELVNVNNLSSTSLVHLKETMITYPLLRKTWDNLVTGDVEKWLLLEHILGLFFKVRGFAVTKLLRKNMQKKHKEAKVKAGTRKALRKELLAAGKK